VRWNRHTYGAQESQKGPSEQENSFSEAGKSLKDALDQVVAVQMITDLIESEKRKINKK
jgi:hypothetical protein